MVYATERPKRYILLDRDGTVIVEKNYLSDPNGVELIPQAAEGLRLLQKNGWGLILLTNQSGIGRGVFTREDLERVHGRLESLLDSESVRLDAIYYCPHAPEALCECRKPKSKMAFDAAAEFGFALQDSWVIGDKPADVELGRNCGARSVLVRTGYGVASEAAGTAADLVADDLHAAAKAILCREGSPASDISSAVSDLGENQTL